MSGEGSAALKLTVSDLVAVFVRNSVPPSYYDFKDTGGGECYILIHNDGAWRTYYSERGGRTGETIYSNEDEACRAMFGLVERMVFHAQHRTILWS